MRTGNYLFRLIVGVMALALGLTAFFVWQFLTYRLASPEIPRLETPVYEIEKVQPIMSVTKPAPEIPQSELPAEAAGDRIEFDAEGDYYVLGELPKDFKDFQSIGIQTVEYATGEDGSMYDKPIPPRIYLYTKREFEFTRINIRNRNILFEAISGNGITYRFIGNFPEPYEDKRLKERVSLEGTLTKLRNGKKVAETKAKFGYIEGCSH